MGTRYGVCARNKDISKISINIKPQSTGYKTTRENMNDTSNVTNTHNGHEFVDIGLPSGNLWATCNVGATSPEQAGLYFAFGETEGFTAEQVTSGVRAFDDESYTAYSVSDNLTLEQDAAHVHMGGGWRIPSERQFKELIDNCDDAWTYDYNGTGVAGRVLTSKINGNSVFLPAAGYGNSLSVIDKNTEGYYWSATGVTLDVARYLNFYSKYIDMGLTLFRHYGHSVRGVCKK